MRTVEDAGYETGVDMTKLREAGAFARAIVEKARAGAADAGAAKAGPRRGEVNA